jgi:hypothetical protein
MLQDASSDSVKMRAVFVIFQSSDADRVTYTTPSQQRLQLQPKVKPYTTINHNCLIKGMMWLVGALNQFETANGRLQK